MGDGHPQMRDAGLEVVRENSATAVASSSLEVGGDAGREVARDGTARRLVGGLDAGLELGPLFLWDLGREVAHAVRQTALAGRAREAGLDRFDDPGRPVGDDQERIAEPPGPHVLEECGHRSTSSLEPAIRCSSTRPPVEVCPQAAITGSRLPRHPDRTCTSCAQQRKARRDPHVRANGAAPKIDALKARLETDLARLPATSATAQAIRYALSRWPALRRYLDDGPHDVRASPCFVVAVAGPAVAIADQVVMAGLRETAALGGDATSASAMIGARAVDEFPVGPRDPPSDARSGGFRCETGSRRPWSRSASRFRAWRRSTQMPPAPLGGEGLVGKEGKEAEDVSGIACAPEADGARLCLLIDDEVQFAQWVTLKDRGSSRASSCR